LSDRPSVDRLTRDLPGDANVRTALRNAAGNPHYQGVAVAHLVARNDVDALSSVAADCAVAEVARFGAVDALGQLATPAAETHLQTIGKSDAEPTELRKAAWRALRRSRRARAAATHSPGTEAKT
jgi:ParB family chromosome partitioning protein